MSDNVPEKNAESNRVKTRERYFKIFGNEGSGSFVCFKP